MSILTYIQKTLLGLVLASCPLLLAVAGPVPVGADSTELVSAKSVTQPNITSSLTVELEYGKPFTYQIVADNEPLGYSVRGLPVWIKRKAGELYGNAVEAGTFKLQIRALNAKGLGPDQELTIIVAPRELKKSPVAIAELTIACLCNFMVFGLPVEPDVLAKM